MTDAAAMSVEAGYDLWAATYDSGANRTRDAASARVEAWAPLFRGRDVLELGCGAGRNTVVIAQTARAVDAVDFSSGMLARAAERPGCASVRFMQHDITKPLPLDSGRYDLVVESLVLEHVQRLGPIFAEAYRLLRAGGEFVGSELHPYRQHLGKQARFQAQPEQAETLITAYRHDISAFVNDALAAGFAVVGLDEDKDPTGELRLFSFRESPNLGRERVGGGDG